MLGKCLHTLHVCDMPCKRHPVSWLGFLGTGVGRRWILPPSPTPLCLVNRITVDPGGMCILGKTCHLSIEEGTPINKAQAQAELVL